MQPLNMSVSLVEVHTLFCDGDVKLCAVQINLNVVALFKMTFSCC